MQTKREIQMAALIRQANSGYELANKREKTKQQQEQQTFSEKKEEAGNVSEQRDKGWIHVIQYTIQPTQQ